MLVVKENSKSQLYCEYKILKEVEKGESSASISKKYGVPKHALPGWLKGKTKIYSKVKKNKTSLKRVRMRLSSHEDLDKTCCMWLLNGWHQSILVSETIFKVKTLQKNLSVKVFKHPMGG